MLQIRECSQRIIHIIYHIKQMEIVQVDCHHSWFSRVWGQALNAGFYKSTEQEPWEDHVSVCLYICY